VGDVTIGVGLGFFGSHSSIPGPQNQGGIFVSFLEKLGENPHFHSPWLTF